MNQSKSKRLYSWFEDRVGLGALRELLNKKTVPLHRHSIWYYFGGMTLFLFCVQVVTGILLMLYYRPSAEGAYESVQFIMTKVPFGWLIRSIHSWSANLMIAAAFAHLFSVFFLKAYRSPRELTWVSGFALLVISMGFGFSGYLLPWNKLAYFATQVGTDIAGVMPLVGGFILRFLRGGDHVTGGTLSRFYGWHVAILPAVTTCLLGLHLLLVQRHGMSVPPAVERRRKKIPQMSFIPEFLLRDLFGWTLALGVLAALAALFPWELGEKADPFAPAFADIKPEWYFMFMFQTLKFVPGGQILGMENEVLAILAFGVLGLVGLCVPFLDRNVRRRGRSPLFGAAGAAMILFMAVMTAIGYHAWWPILAAAVLVIVPWTAGRMGGRRNRGRGATTSLVLVALLAASGLASAAEQGPAGEVKKVSSCIACHGQLEDELLQPVTSWGDDVHGAAGLGCEACHGGDASAEAEEDPERAMSAENGFRPKPSRLEIPAFCGGCHSDAGFMKQYNPQVRVDQLAEYRTSVHGVRNAAGDPVPATCIDCHGSHGIRPVTSPDSPVHAAKVPATCARCHSDASLMAPYGIPTDQYDSYRRSVHAAALLERGDTAAPACNDCHGNHGATPPGVQSVANVCGQCHGRESQLFRASFKKDLFDEMEMAECTVCHGNHLVVHPTPELFRSGSAPSTSRGEITGLDPLAVDLGDLEPGARAEIVWAAALSPHLNAGDVRLGHRVVVSLDGVDSLELDATVEPGTLSESETRRAETPELSASLIIEPLSGVPVKPGDAVRYRLELEAKEGSAARSVGFRDRRLPGVTLVPGSVCLTCHSPGDKCDRATEEMHAALSAADRELREAERLLRRAEVAGMDVTDVQFDLNSRGTTAALDARALIHSFDPKQLVKRAADARAVAASALEAGKAALAELQFRRRGLAVSLVLILLVLVGLFLKIRDVDSARRSAGREEPGAHTT